VRELKQKAWLHRIAVNVVRNRVRGVRPRLVELNGSEPSAASGPEEDVIRKLEVETNLRRDGSCSRQQIHDTPAVGPHEQPDQPEQKHGVGEAPPGEALGAIVHRGLKMLRGENDGDVDE
jgi:DNA-directed RNA polymerase specialized sigma24 family protein